MKWRALIFVLATAALCLGFGAGGRERSLREAAQGSGMFIGTAVRPAQLSEAAYASTLAREFNMLEPEDVLKWEEVHPSPAFRFLSRGPDCGFRNPARHEGSWSHAGLASSESTMADGRKIHFWRACANSREAHQDRGRALSGQDIRVGCGQ